MPKGNKKDQERTIRTLNISMLINRCPHVFTTSMLADRFNISKTTVHRDIDFIRQTGIVVEIRTGKKGYSMPTDFRKALRRINETNKRMDAQ